MDTTELFEAGTDEDSVSSAALPPASPAPLPSSAAPPPSPRHPCHPRQDRRSRSWSSPAAKPCPMTYEQFQRYQGRLEVWDAESETAWMVREPTSAYHETPSHGLAGLVERIARGARLADLLLRLDGPGDARRARPARRAWQAWQARRAWEAEAHHAGGPDGVPVSVAGGVGEHGGAGGGRAQLPGRGAGGGPHDGRSAGEAEAVRGVGVPGDLGGGAGRSCAEPSEGPAAGADDPPAGGGCLPSLAGECGVPWLDGRGRPRGDERAEAFGADERGSGSVWAGGWGRGRARGRTTMR